MKSVRAIPSLPPRKAHAHKGDFGTVLVVAGSEGMLGAAILCAEAALRTGAGLVRVALPKPLLPLLPVAVPAATTVLRTDASLKAQLKRVDAVVVGPGLGDLAATKRLVGFVLRHAAVPVVLDADALNVLAPLTAALESSAPLVLTPHPGEAGRLLGTSAQAVQADRPQALAALCKKSGAVVVLKGAGTLVSDGVRLFSNRTGNPGMATGGCGDVLTGLCGALLARGMTPFQAACLGVHLHGRAGDRVARRLGQNGLIASDLPLAIAEELP
jgi:NAD(P)H-hydrate epimerase